MMRSYTDKEQSKKLAKILPIETADMFWRNGLSDKRFQFFNPYLNDGTNMDYDYDLPCWSLAALLEVLTYPDLQKTDDNWYCCKSFHGSTIVEEGGHTAVDACVNVIIKLKENNLL